MATSGEGLGPGVGAALEANATPDLLLLGVVHDVGVVHRRLLLRDLPSLAFPLRLVVLCLHHLTSAISHYVGL